VKWEDFFATEDTMDKIVDIIIDRLNVLLQRDPTVVESMLNMKVNCNSKFRKDPTIFTYHVNENEQMNFLNLLGFLNSILSPLPDSEDFKNYANGPRISLRYETGPVEFFNTKKLL